MYLGKMKKILSFLRLFLYGILGGLSMENRTINFATFAILMEATVLYIMCHYYSGKHT